MLKKKEQVKSQRKTSKICSTNEKNKIKSEKKKKQKVNTFHTSSVNSGCVYTEFSKQLFYLPKETKNQYSK